MSGDGFLRGHQVSRVLGVAVPVAVFLVWWGWSGGRGDVVAEAIETGRVVERSGKTCLVETAGGERTRLWCPPRMEAGTAVRIRRLTHESGELRFELVQNAAKRGDAT
jgi:hypothetical protein